MGNMIKNRYHGISKIEVKRLKKVSLLRWSWILTSMGIYNEIVWGMGHIRVYYSRGGRLAAVYNPPSDSYVINCMVSYGFENMLADIGIIDEQAT